MTTQLTEAGQKLVDALVKAGAVHVPYLDDEDLSALNTAAQILLTPEGGGMRTYLTAQMDWSRRAFGDRSSAIGLTKHIEKECAEVRANPRDLTEWVDIIILALDGYWRHGGTPDTIVPDLTAKQAKNFAREWPVNENPDEPNEHDRSGETAPKTSVPGNDAGMREALAHFMVERQHGSACADYVREKNCGSWQAAIVIADAMIAGPLARALSPPAGSAGDDETGVREALRLIANEAGAYTCFRSGSPEAPDSTILTVKVPLGLARKIDASLPRPAPQPPKAETPAGVDVRERVTLDYTNYRGERAIRTITPWGVEWGTTDWHPDPGWLLTCYDHDRAACRTYALSGIHSWNGEPATLAPAARTGDGVERVRMAEGCTSAISPCSYQRDFPDLLCDFCMSAALTAAPAANGESA